jgi:hypothetical protein
MTGKQAALRKGGVLPHLRIMKINWPYWPALNIDLLGG